MAKAAFEMGARNCDQEQVALKTGYNGIKNGAYKGLRAAGNYFGLLSYQDEHYLSVTEPWIAGFHGDDPEDLKKLRQSAIKQPELYRQLIEDFKERQLPGPEKLARHLHINTKYGILKDAADTAARTFLESASYAGMVDSHNYLRIGGTAEGLQEDSRSDNSNSEGGASRAPASTVLAALGGSSQAEAVGNPGLVIGDADGLDRFEVQLANGKRAYLFVPVPLAGREKERLKKYIDLILEPEELAETQPTRGGFENVRGAEGGSSKRLGDHAS